MIGATASSKSGPIIFAIPQERANHPLLNLPYPTLPPPPLPLVARSLSRLGGGDK